MGLHLILAQFWAVLERFCDPLLELRFIDLME